MIRNFKNDCLTGSRAEKLILNQELATTRSRILNSEDERRVSVVARLGRRHDNRNDRFRSRSSSSDRSRSYSGNRNKFFNKRFAGKPSYLCSFCKKKGHTRKFCYRLKDKSPRKSKQGVKFVDSPKPSVSGTSALFKRLKTDIESTTDDEDMPCMMVSTLKNINEPCYVEVLIEQKRLTMEIDCGSAETVISEELFKISFSHLEIESCKKKLVVIDGKKLNVVGKTEVSVQLEGNTKFLSLVILNCKINFIPLMGRTWLDVFYAGWRDIFTKPKMSAGRIDMIKKEQVIDDIKSKFSNVFDRDFSNPIVGFEGDLILKDDNPIFRKAYECQRRDQRK